MKKKNKIWIVLMTAFVTLFNSVINVNAQNAVLSITYPDGYSTGRMVYGWGSGLVCEDGKDHRLFKVGGEERFLGVFRLNGEIVYCIQPFVETKNGYTYTTTASAKDVINAALLENYELASYFGYGYNNDYSLLSAIATQHAIWEFSGAKVEDITAELRNQIDTIKQRVENYKNKLLPSFHNQTFVFKGIGEENAIVLKDENNSIADWLQVYKDDALHYAIEGNTIKVWVDQPFFDEKTIEYNLYDPNDARVSGNSIVYIHPNNAQRLVCLKDPVKRSTSVSFSMGYGDVEIFKYKNANSLGTGKQTYEKDAEFIVMNKKYIQTYGTIENAYAHKDEIPSMYYEKLITNENGYAKSEKLLAGEYIIKQIKGAIDTVLYPSELDFTISDSNQETVRFTLTNVLYSSFLKINKRDENNELIKENAMYFKIKDNDGKYVTYFEDGKLQDMWCTDATGSIVLPFTLDAGNYYLEEISPPDGFIVKNELVPFAITNKDRTENIYEINIINQKPSAQIRIQKQFEEGIGFVGEKVKFALYANSDILNPTNNNILYHKNEKIGEYSLDLNHTLIIEELPMGKGEVSYYIEEIQTYDNYILDTTKHYFNFKIEDKYKDTYVVDKTIVNEGIKMKTNAYDAKDNDKEIYAKGEVELMDHVYYEGLKVGKTYTLKGKVVECRSGELVYDKNNQPIMSEVSFVAESSNGYIDVQYRFEASNIVHKKIVIFEELYNEHGELILAHNNLDDVNQTIVVLPVHKLCIYKIDAKTFSLIKDEFEMALYYDRECTELVDTQISMDASGTLTFMDLPYGIYYLKELNAPKGYTLLNECIKIEILENEIQVDGESKSLDEPVVVFNKKIEPVTTGDLQKSLHHLYAFTFVGVLIFYLRKNK